jgi:hypothetical protein
MKNINAQLEDLEERIHVLSERSYSPEISGSELREINKRKKKLLKNKEKLLRKFEHSNAKRDYNELD